MNTSSRILIEMATGLGWTETRMRATTKLHAPAPFISKTIVVPHDGLRESLRKSHTRTLIRYGDPIKIAAVIATLPAEARRIAEEVFPQLREGLPATPSYAPRTPRKGVPAPAALPTLEPAPASPQIAAEPVPAAPTTPATAPQIVSEQPWLAHRGAHPNRTGGRRYESHAVKERHWSDGHVDYVCAKPGCGYARPKALSVARHYGNSSGHPRPKADAERPLFFDPDYTDPVGPPRSGARIDRWQHRLRLALAGLDLSQLCHDKDQLAHAIAEHLVDLLPSIGSGEGPVELAPEEILDRIRRLVDRGEGLKMRSELSEATRRVSLLEIELATAREASEAAAHRAQAAEDRWTALQSLIMSEGTAPGTPQEDDS